ncbi:LytR/AlgR family response regulator transcription factor [Fibrella aquatilis]|uniref:LytTR family transcriptional regulator n=1 Tax=Fibrella aquatilis TaxID=2817059 RepID=A0A939JZ91_9BACT|nr:LytTR family DNA-binding domain-containing protein [Fibrella aquatilis]MBO0931178.1 LytTR family transcriptional regulator [Fibrella aquatilis]
MLTFARQLRRRNHYSLIFWVAITLVFLYERTYLIQKAGLPHFIECLVVRVGLLVVLCQFHLRVLLPRFYQKKAYWTCGGLLCLSIGGYLTAQGLYDRYLFGYVIGDQHRQGLFQNLPYNLLTTTWYLLLTSLIGETKTTDSPSEVEPTTLTDNELLIKTGTQWVRLPIDSISYAQGLKDYTMLYTDTGKHIVKGSVGKLIGPFPPDQFVRIHKSYWVAWQQVRSVSATSVTLPAHTLPLGRTYAAAVLGRWQQQTTSLRETPAPAPRPRPAASR